MTDRAGLARCREELAAARLLADKGFEAQAVSHAYFAAFFAAETALLALGETRSKHSGRHQRRRAGGRRGGGMARPPGLP
jgi:uncharacterized protein (UPF0332 family)